MKPKLLLLFTLVVFGCLGILQSCVPPEDDSPPNCDNSTEHYSLSATQKKILPYTGYDTISMVSNMGDTIHCIGTGKQYFTTREFQPYGNPECAGHGTEKLYEAYKIEFVDSVKKEKILVAHYSLVNNPSGLSTPNQLNTIVIDFKNFNFYIYAPYVSSSTVYNYWDSLSINRKIYYRVTREWRDYSDSTSSIYLNKSSGVLKFDLNNMVIWEKL